MIILWYRGHTVMDDQLPKSDLSSDAPTDTPIPLAPVDFVTSEPSSNAASATPLPDALPGDAAPTPLMPLAPAVETPANPRVTIIRPPAAPAAAVSPRGVSFALWALIWVVAWSGCMALTLNHRFDRKFDWNTSYFSIAARNLVNEGFAKLHGGVYLLAGHPPTYANHERDDFYAGHPPLTAWLLAGWMKLFGSSDAIIRALPLAFTALNLLLLYALVKRVFGAPAALATTVICSLLPMTVVYAQYVNMEPFVLTFLLGAALGYLGWSRSGSKFGFLFMSLCIILGCWTDWPMYIFTGFLAIAHFFRRRDLLTPLPRTTEGGAIEEERPGFPVLSSLFLIVLPMAVFAVFLVYLKLNGSKFSELLNRATERREGGLGTLLEQLRDPANKKGDHEFVHGFISLLCLPALFLATIGAVFWAHWSRRLSLASGEAGRRAVFRIVLCLLLMQLVYTLVFPNGAVVHEFWQYYLIVPVAILAAAFCTWLTVVGGVGRKFSLGLYDRAGWAVAAAIPFLAFGPVIYRLQISGLGKEAHGGDPRLGADYAGALSKSTHINDIFITDWTQGKVDAKEESPSTPEYHEALGYALPWYLDRTMLPHDPSERDTRTLEGINKIRADETFKGRRILYLWSTDGSSALEQTLNIKFPQYIFGKAIVYLIQGQPDASWKKAGIESTATPPVVTPPILTPPVVISPATKPAPAATKPASKPTATAPAKPK
jgi:hypothetical protein